MANRILICRSNPVAPDPRVEKIALSLKTFGYSVQILGWDRTGSIPVKENSKGIPIERLAILARFGQGMGNLPQLIRWQWGLTRWLMTHRSNYDCIHACDFDTILPSLLMKILYKKKVVYDIFDFYADHLRKTPQIFKEIIRWTDVAAINHVDGVIIVDDARVEQIKPAKPQALEIIYNSPEDQSGLSNAPNGDGDQINCLRIAYIGLLQVERGILEMLAVLQKHPEWVLDLAGFGGDQEKLLEQATGMSNVTWHGRIPYQEALEISQNADLLFATYDPTITNHRYASPNKVFEAMMLAKPLIVARGTNVDRIIEKYHCGIVVPYGNVVELERALASFAENLEQRKAFGMNARSAYDQVFGWKRMEERLLHLYKQVLPA